MPCYVLESFPINCVISMVQITTIQILSIYGKSQAQTNLKHAAQNKKLSTVYSAEIYRTAQLNQHEWHTDTYRHKLWVRILENKNVGYKSICLSGKVNNGLLNDLFQVYVYSPVFSHEIPSFDIFIPYPRSPFYEQLQLWQNVCRPTQYKTKHLSLVLSKPRKYRAVSQLSLPVLFYVLFIEQCYTRLLTTPQRTIMWSDEWSY